MADRNRHSSYALVYAAILAQLQEIAREHGYALGVHGSMATDLDLIACPWTDDAGEPQDMIDAFCKYLKLMWDIPDVGNPVVKPHGRLAWCLHFDHKSPYSVGGPYLDVSVMPRSSR